MTNRNDIQQLFKAHYAQMYRLAVALLYEDDFARRRGLSWNCDFSLACRLLIEVRIDISKIGADLWFYSAANSQNCYIKPTRQISLSLRKSFFNDNLILQLKAVDILDRATDKVTIYSGDIQTYMYNHREPRNINFTIRYIFNKARSKYKGTGAGKTEKRRM